jgi:hypothetical protein
MTTERSRHLATHPGSSTNGRSSRASGLSWSATRSTLPVPTTSHDDGRVQADASTGPARPAPASIAWFQLGQMTSRSWTRRATTPTPAIPAMRLPAPPPPSTTSLQADTADAGTHGHRTPTLDTGRRTPGRSDARTGHWAPVAWTGTRGHWTLALDTGHWTLDAGRGRGHGDEGTVGIRPPRLPRQRPRAGPPNRVPVDSAAALGNHDGSAVGHLLGRSAGKAAPRRIAVLESDGWRVERAARLHPL